MIEKEFPIDQSEGDKQISRLYLGHDEIESPKTLDDKILAESKKAVGAGPQRIREKGKKHWHVPMSFAAALAVFSITGILVHNTMRESDTLRESDLLRESGMFDESQMLKESQIEREEGFIADETIPKEMRPQEMLSQEMMAEPVVENALPAPGTAADGGGELVGRGRETKEQAPARAPAPAASFQPPLPLAKPMPSLGASKAAKKDSLRTIHRPKEMGGETRAIRQAEPWLEHIKQLLSNEQQQQAISELKEFRQYYPDYPLEQALVDLLDKVKKI